MAADTRYVFHLTLQQTHLLCPCRVDMVYNGNGLWQQAGSTHTLNTAEGACADSTQYLQLGCTCAAGTISHETCDSPIEWCRNCTKVGTAGNPQQHVLQLCIQLAWLLYFSTHQQAQLCL